MSDTLAVPLTPTVVLTVADVAAPRPLDDELVDEDLEQLVGGLARTWSAGGPSMLDAGPSYTVARLEARDMTQRISA